MRILYLCNSSSPLIDYLLGNGEELIVTKDKIDMNFINSYQPEFIVSYGYRYIISKEILKRYPDAAVNLHISFLPWNRGADPNFWSFVENTPKGVTIHYLDEGVDTGDIIVQKQVEFSEQETLHTSYMKLHEEMQSLFKYHWVDIRVGKCHRIPQCCISQTGSSHKLADKQKLSFLLTDGWHTSVKVLEEYAAETQLSSQFFLLPN